VHYVVSEAVTNAAKHDLEAAIPITG